MSHITVPKTVLRGLELALRFSDVYVEQRMHVTSSEKTALEQARAWLSRAQRSTP